MSARSGDSLAAPIVRDQRQTEKGSKWNGIMGVGQEKKQSPNCFQKIEMETPSYYAPPPTTEVSGLAGQQAVPPWKKGLKLLGYWFRKGAGRIDRPA